jgi:hypothetical protein
VTLYLSVRELLDLAFAAVIALGALVWGACALVRRVWEHLPWT